MSELFEARISKNSAIISDIEGKVVFEGLHHIKLQKSCNYYKSGEPFEYNPRDKKLIVADGDRMKSGDMLTAGVPVLHDISQNSWT